jgi:hypothetical protein
MFDKPRLKLIDGKDFILSTGMIVGGSRKYAVPVITPKCVLPEGRLIRVDIDSYDCTFASATYIVLKPFDVTEQRESYFTHRVARESLSNDEEHWLEWLTSLGFVRKVEITTFEFREEFKFDELVESVRGLPLEESNHA